MKQYKSSEELLDYIISKGVTVTNRDYALDKIKKYSYYSIVNTYKDVFKTSDNNYKKNVTLKKYIHYMNLIKIFVLFF